MTLEQQTDYLRAEQGEHALVRTDLTREVQEGKDKEEHHMLQTQKAFREIGQATERMNEQQNKTETVYLRDRRYNMEAAVRLAQDMKEEEENIAKVAKEVRLPLVS